MKRRQTYLVRLGEVRLIRNGDVVEIHYPESDIPVTHLTIGHRLATMTDQEVIDIWNDGLRAKAELAAEYNHVAVEIPLGSPQMEYHELSGQWVPRGDVLRCLVNDDQDRMPVIEIDDHELTWEQFAKLVVVYAGWGMRITFVPDDEIHRHPRVEVREPKHSPQD
jgi:hypothetical protein